MSTRNFFVSLGDSFYYWLLARELRGMTSVLDLGCGARSPISKIKKTFYSVGYDMFPQSVATSKKDHIHDTYVRDDVLRADTHFPKSSFDAVIALDLIEHLPKQDGKKLIDVMSKLAKKKVIIMTPNGFYKQEPYENNPFQVHKSGWKTKDFTSRGFRVYGIRGLKWLRGEYATIKYSPWFFWSTISVLSQFFIFEIPSISYQLFAVKRMTQ